MAKETAVVAGDDQDFDKAFDAAAVEGAAKVQAKAEEKKEEPKVEEKKEEPKVEEKKEEPKVEEKKEETAEEKTAREAAEAKTALETKAREEAQVKIDAEAKVRQEAQERVAAETKARADAEAKTKADADAKAAAEALAKPYEPTAEEKAALEKLKTEWPEQHAALAAQLNSTNKEIQRQVQAGIAEAMKAVGQVVAPLAAQVKATAEERHVATIVAAHADAETIAPKVEEWIKTQPSYLKTAYAAVMADGSAQEIVDLFTRYKTEAGLVTTKVEEKEEKKGPTAEEIAAGAPVQTRRASPAAKGGVNNQDFDGAFDEASAAAK